MRKGAPTYATRRWVNCFASTQRLTKKSNKTFLSSVKSPCSRRREREFVSKQSTTSKAGKKSTKIWLEGSFKQNHWPTGANNDFSVETWPEIRLWPSSWWWFHSGRAVQVTFGDYDVIGRLNDVIRSKCSVLYKVFPEFNYTCLQKVLQYLSFLEKKRKVVVLNKIKLSCISNDFCTDHQCDIMKEIL